MKPQIVESLVYDQVTNAEIIKLYNTKDRMNPVVQFDIDNTGPANKDQILRIGSLLAMPGAAHKFKLLSHFGEEYRKGASDDTIIRDQGGVGCIGVQAFSELCNHTEVIISQIRIISQNPRQLKTRVEHKTIFPDLILVQSDGTRDEDRFIKFEKTAESCLTVADGEWPLSASQCFELEILANTEVSIIIEIDKMANIKTFSRIGDGVGDMK